MLFKSLHSSSNNHTHLGPGRRELGMQSELQRNEACLSVEFLLLVPHDRQWAMQAMTARLTSLLWSPDSSSIRTTTHHTITNTIREHPNHQMYSSLITTLATSSLSVYSSVCISCSILLIPMLFHLANPKSLPIITLVIILLHRDM